MIMTKEEIKGLLVTNSREWIKEVGQDVAVVYVDDFIDELLNKLMGVNKSHKTTLTYDEFEKIDRESLNDELSWGEINGY